MVISSERWNYDREEVLCLGVLVHWVDYSAKCSVRKYCRKDKISKERRLGAEIGEARQKKEVETMRNRTVSWVAQDKGHEIVVKKERGKAWVVFPLTELCVLDSVEPWGSRICKTVRIIGEYIKGINEGNKVLVLSIIRKRKKLGGRIGISINVLRRDKIGISKARDLSRLITMEIRVCYGTFNVSGNDYILEEGRSNEFHVLMGNKDRGLDRSGEEGGLFIKDNAVGYLMCVWKSREGKGKDQENRASILWRLEGSVGIASKREGGETSGVRSIGEHGKYRNRRKTIIPWRCIDKRCRKSAQGKKWGKGNSKGYLLVGARCSKSNLRTGCISVRRICIFVQGIRVIWVTVENRMQPVNVCYVWYKYCSDSSQKVKRMVKNKYNTCRIKRNSYRMHANLVWNDAPNNCKCSSTDRIQIGKRKVKKRGIKYRVGSSGVVHKLRVSNMVAEIERLGNDEMKGILMKIKYNWLIGRNIAIKEQIRESYTNIEIKLRNLQGRKPRKTKNIIELWICNKTKDSNKKWVNSAVWDNSTVRNRPSTKANGVAYDGAHYSSKKVDKCVSAAEKNFICRERVRLYSGTLTPILLIGSGNTKGRSDKLVGTLWVTCDTYVASVDASKDKLKECRKVFRKPTSTNILWDSTWPNKVVWRGDKNKNERLSRHKNGINTTKSNYYIAKWGSLRSRRSEKIFIFEGSKHKKNLSVVHRESECRVKYTEIHAGRWVNTNIKTVKKGKCIWAYSSIKGNLCSGLEIKKIVCGARADDWRIYQRTIRGGNEWVMLTCLPMEGISHNVNRSNVTRDKVSRGRDTTPPQILKRNAYLKNMGQMHRRIRNSSLAYNIVHNMYKIYGTPVDIVPSVAVKIAVGTKYKGNKKDIILRNSNDVDVKGICVGSDTEFKSTRKKRRILLGWEVVVDVLSAPNKQHGLRWGEKYFGKYDANIYWKFFEHMSMNSCSIMCGEGAVDGRKYVNGSATEEDFKFCSNIQYCNIETIGSPRLHWRNRGRKGINLNNIKKRMTVIKCSRLYNIKANSNLSRIRVKVNVICNSKSWLENVSHEINHWNSRHDGYTGRSYNLDKKYKIDMAVWKTDIENFSLPTNGRDANAFNLYKMKGIDTLGYIKNLYGNG